MERGALHSCLLEITNVCNFRCPHCYVDKKNAKYLPFEDVKVFADELYELNCNSITLTGGEIFFTHFEFNKIYEYLYEKGFLISINTNSSLINDEVIELFKKMPPNIVEISLYGYDEETYYCPGKFKMSTQDFQTPPEWFCDLGQSIYKKYVDGFHMIRKCYLNNKELSKIFGIVSNNMKKLGFEISAKDETVWKENLQRNLTDEKFYFYVIYQNGEIVGFVEVGVFEDKLFLSELQLCDNAKNTRVLPNILNRLVELDELANFDKIYFKINKNNIKSQKTFEHLGAVKNAENSSSYSYVLGKNNVKKYLKKIKR